MGKKKKTDDLPFPPDSEQEQTYTFAEQYAGSDGAPADQDDGADQDRPRGKRFALRRADKPGKPEKAPKMSRREKKRQAQAIQEKVVRQAPTVGRDLKSGQMLVYDSELDEVDYTDPEDLPEARDYMPIRFRRYGRIGIGGGILYALCVISISIILASFGWMCAVDVLALNKEEASAPVTILPYEPTGDMPTTVERKNADGTTEEVEIKVDIDQVADALKNNGIIEYKWLFKIFAAISHANIKMDPGTYNLNTSYDYRALVTKMQFGSDSQETTKVTFPEGFTEDQIFTLLEQSFVCRKADLYEAVETYDFDYDFLKDVPLGDRNRLEGYLFPDTYEFYQGESAVTAISRFLDNTERKLSEDILNGAANLNLSVHQMLTVASMIEKEAAGAEGERENMASVIYNRLNAGWPLQIDSTVNYALGTNTLDLTSEQLQTDDPYNTYVYEGLPPGPICCPGLAAIQAAVAPNSTGYWFWYSVDGETYFFTSAEEQEAFVRSHPY